MKTYKQHIEEIFNKSFYKVHESNISRPNYFFGYFIPDETKSVSRGLLPIIPDEVYIITFGESFFDYIDDEKDTYKEETNVWELGFAYIPPGKFDKTDPARSAMLHSNVGKLPTNKHNVIKIFSTVAVTFINYIKEHNIDKNIIFRTYKNDQTKVELYKKFAKFFHKRYEDEYDLDTKENDTHIIFIFRKKK